MLHTRTQPFGVVAALFVMALGVPSARAADHLRGVVTGRAADGTVMVRTDAADVAVVIDEDTKVRERSGLRSIKVDVASLIAGLRVDVEGTSVTEARFIGDRITFSRTDLKIARDIQAGLTPANETVAANQQQNNQRFNQQQASLEQHDRRIASNDEKIVATSGRLDATNGRIATLDDYTVVETVTVYFRNGKSDISREYRTQLQQLAERARGVDGYRVQVEGFASAVGRDALNQELSRDRAEAVASVLQQNGMAPTKMLVPAAMGVSDQVAGNDTKEGQAQNRRAVVRVLQNRGITGN